jgi:hypothetical protein
MRRSIALTATAALALTLGLALPARAEDPAPPEGPNPRVIVKIDKPSPGDVAGIVDVSASIELRDIFTVSLKEWRVELVGVGVLCSGEYAAPAPGGPDPAPNPVPIRLRLDTTRTPGASAGENGCSGGANPVLPAGGALSPNRAVTLRVWGTTFTNPATEQHFEGDDTVALGVENAPAAPTGLKLGYSGGYDGEVSVQWNRNPEPDVRRYRLAECVVDRSSKPCAASDWQLLGGSSGLEGTSFGIPTAGPGIYRYRVAALRPDAHGGTMASGWTVPTSDPLEIQVLTPPPSTTPTTKPKAGGSQNTSRVDRTPETIVRTQTVYQPTRRVQRAAPQVLQRVVERPQSDDRPFSETLPYGEDSEAFGRPPLAGSEGGDQRAMLVPVAFGTLLLVGAGWVRHLNRRAQWSLEALPVAGYGEDARWIEPAAERETGRGVAFDEDRGETDPWRSF